MRLLRGEGPLIRVGHRGAAALSPENTLRSFDTAVAAGVDAIEFDVLDLVGGPLVLAHSNDLFEVSHGLAAGTVRDRSLAELREVAPELDVLAAMWTADAVEVDRREAPDYDAWTDDRAPVEWITDRMIVEYGLEGGDLDEDYLPTRP